MHCDVCNMEHGGVFFSGFNVPKEIRTHYDDVIMTMLASQITSLPVVCSIVYSDVNQRKHQSSASLAFVREIHRGPVNFPHKWPVTRKMFPFDDVIMSKGLVYFASFHSVNRVGISTLPLIPAFYPETAWVYYCNVINLIVQTHFPFQIYVTSASCHKECNK